MRQHWGEKDRTPATRVDLVMEWAAVAFSVVMMAAQATSLFRWLTGLFR